MKSIYFLLAISAGASTGLQGCGDNTDAGLIYTNPPTGAGLRLVKDKASNSLTSVLNLVVGDAALTGYSTGFNLPVDANLVTFGSLTPGTVLNPGTAPVAAIGTIANVGPLKGVLTAGLSQKASGAGAIATDTSLPAGTVLFTITLDAVAGGKPGIVFDGTADGFVLLSGGLRNREGVSVVDAANVAIGKLEVR
jgi:hypothetical protein